MSDTVSGSGQSLEGGGAVGACRQIIAVVKPFRAEAVLEELSRLGIEDCVVREARGFGRQKGHLRRYQHGVSPPSFVPKVQIVCQVPQHQVQAAVQAIVRAARTGRIGDGKVFVVPQVIDP